MTWEHLSNQKGDKRNSPLNTWRKMRIGWGVPKLTVLTINWEQQPTRGWMRWVERVGEVARDVERVSEELARERENEIELRREGEKVWELKKRERKNEEKKKVSEEVERKKAKKSWE